jgi:acyl carrier protein
MDDATIRAKLTACFSAVFPELRPDEIASATIESTNRWDSIAHVTLLTLVGEEFGINVEIERYANAVSFSAFAALIGESVSMN